MMLTHVQLITRIAVGASLGGTIGYERDLHGRHVGLRTHSIVAMASATFMVLSAHFAFYQDYDASTQHIDVDASRIAASVVSGVGFLAGGAILRTGLTIQGLTTAAGLWLVTAIGLCSGAGMYIESIAVTIMGIIALSFLRLFEDKDDKLIKRRVNLVMTDAPERITNTISALSEIGIEVSEFDYEKKIDDKTIAVSFEAKVPVATGVNQLMEALESQQGMRQVHIKTS